MPVTLQSAVRVNPVPCQHFDLTINKDAALILTSLRTSDIEDPVTDDEIRVLVRLWARYHVGKGKTLSELVGETLFTDIP